MKQEISPGKGNALHETLVHNAVESASPEYAGHGQATDLPFVVVKLEDEPWGEHYSSDTESVESEWMRPVESTEDEEADQDPTSETDVTSFTSEKHPILSLQKHPNDALPKQEYPDERGKENAAGTTFFSHDTEDSGLPKKRVSKQNNKSSTSPSIRRSKRSVGRKTKSSSQFSESQINTERTENGQKTLSAVKKLAVVYKKADARPTREPTKRKTSQRSSTKDPANSSDAEEPEWRNTSTKRPFPSSSLHHPPAWGLELGTQEVGSSAFGVSAPYSRLKPACAISPQLATEPPPFPSMEDDRKPKCCEKLEGIVFEVLNYCKFMCTTIQRLEERIDSLQTNSSHLQETHRNFPIPEEVSWHRGRHSSPWAAAPPFRDSRFGPSRLSLQSGPSLGPPGDVKGPLAPAASGPRPPRSGYAGRPSRLASYQLDRPAPARSRRGGRRRGRARGKAGQSRGRAGQPPAEPANEVQAFAAPPSGAGAMDELPVKVASKGPSSTADGGDQQLVLIGSSLRKVQISASEYLKAFKEADPPGAVSVVLRAVFPDAVLARSGVTGNLAAGVLQLDPNKIEAIREWLAEMFPKHDLGVRGTDWATCLGAISSVIKELRSGEGQEVA